jgi:hypothetical protein
MRRSMKALVPVFLVACGMVSTSEATIQRVDKCGQQFSRTAGVPVVRGATSATRVTVRGDLVDTNTGVETPSGITSHVIEKTGGGGLNTTVTIDLTAASGTSLGTKQIKLHYAVEFSGPDVFEIDVRDLRIDTITMIPNLTHILKGTEVAISVTGAGLADLQLKTATRSAFTDFHVVSANDTSTSFVGNAQSTTNLTPVAFFSPSVSSNEGCGAAHGNAQLVALNVGLPNLVPFGPTGVYALTNPAEFCAGAEYIPVAESVCSNPFSSIPAPTAAVPHVEGLVRVPSIRWGVMNNTPFPMPSKPFKIQLKLGINVLEEAIVNPEEFTDNKKFANYNRPENRRMVMRDFGCPKCYDMRVAPYNWIDPVYTVVVDVDHDIAESNESDNSRGSN